MQAAYYEATGPARTVLTLGELPDPEPAAGEVRVRLKASGVNPSDVKSRAGLRSKTMPFARVVPHSDGAGVIDRVGAGVPPSRIGERVWVWNAAWGRSNGTAAEYVALPAQQAVPLPASVSFEAGACFGIPALTALHAVQGFGGVEGKNVLVAGGAGAVGHYAIQFARLLGARQVIATVSSETKARLAREAGADAVVDYKHQDVAAQVRTLTAGLGADRVIEVDVAANGKLDADLLRPGGEGVVYGSGAGEFSLPFFPLIAKNLTLHFFIVYQLGGEERMRAHATLARLLGEGRLAHNVAQRLPLSQIVQAHEMVEAGQVLGNVVVTID
jgi:NADPH2:quinone reductase